MCFLAVSAGDLKVATVTKVCKKCSDIYNLHLCWIYYIALFIVMPRCFYCIVYIYFAVIIALFIAIVLPIYCVKHHFVFGYQ